MNKLHWGWKGILCAVIGVSVLLIADLLSAFAGLDLSMKLRLGMSVVVSGAVFLFGPKSFKKLSVLLLSLLGCIFMGLTAFYASIGIFSDTSDYRNADIDSGVKSYYAEQRVMLIVPHQDDEVNVMGGAIEEYVRYGSEVYVVYLTNGDLTPYELRFSEAIDCLAKQNIPEDHVIFLGYGDQWVDGPHLYNAEPGKILQSKAGNFATYGTADHPAYREGADYTVENLLANMESVILEYRPDVIYCCDYDAHGEHKATSLVFEKVMGRILQRGTDYQPRIFKGFAYRTAWFGIDDFYDLNMKSTTKYYAEGYVLPVDHYRWADRIRLPVEASGLSRSLPGSGQYDLLKSHVSQEAQTEAKSVINGDRVFWERYTTSLCNRAEIKVTSGDADFLNDFMLLETKDLLDGERWPCDGVWHPEETDPEKRATVILSEKSDLTSIVLYDNPEPGQNVLQVVITFDNGEQVVTGPLDPYGAANVIAVDQKQVAFFEVELTSMEGKAAGLTEIEAFSDSPENPGGFVQLMDAEEEFVYDYITDPSGELVLQVYGYGSIPELTPENYSVSCDNENCSVVWSEQGIVVSCPAGEAVTVSVMSEEDGIWDRAYIQNPGKLKRLWIKVGQHGEILAEELREVPQEMKYHLDLWGGQLSRKLGFADPSA